MAYTLQKTASAKSDPTAKNRVWDFFAESNRTRPASRRQPQQLRRKNRPCTYKTASGIPLWPSRDPIGERGGINLYGFVGNDGLNKWDVLGMEKFKTFDDDPATFLVSPKEAPAGADEDGVTEASWPAGARVGTTWTHAYYFETWASELTDHPQKVTLVGGKLEQKAYYYTRAKDIEYVKKHERKHVEINKMYWNMFAKQINWLETDWCKPCGELAVVYVNATQDYREQQMRLAHAEYHVQEYASYHDIKKYERTAETVRQSVAKAKIAYDAAYKAFWPKCKGKNKT